ncbi:hypothetical protein MalM25_17920 [Planctomycetes bacterium MalM25]|nr:hypothetical protein MalM25_17920 [Planctomycetes bacterium MalM25]
MKARFGWLLGVSTAFSLVLIGPTRADMLVNDFGDGVQSWRFDFGSPITPGLSRDATEGSPGNAQGALRMDMTYVASQGGNNNFAFTGDVFFPETDLSGYDNVEFDLKIADGAALDAFGNHGFFQFVSRETGGYSFNSVLGQNLAPNTGVWIPFSVPTDTMTATRAFTIQLYGGPSQNIDGPITLFLDNVRLTNNIPEPTGLVVAGLLGLTALASRRR